MPWSPHRVGGSSIWSLNWTDGQLALVCTVAETYNTFQQPFVHRPLDSEGGLLAPIHDLDRYRAQKQFRHPACFCSTLENPVVESAFYIPGKGPYRGFCFWAVGCTWNDGIGCSYFGTYFCCILLVHVNSHSTVPIERLYRHEQIPRRSYPSRS